MDFSKELKEQTAYCDRVIEKYLPSEEGFEKQVVTAMNYSVLAGGKRLRPMLISQTYQMYGGNSSLVEPFMAALEMIHTYSLVHDDLPAMDNDEYRRGRKTTHAVYGEGMAILAGDGLLNFAYETAVSAFSMASSAEETNRVIQALRILTSNAGIYGMVGGQCADLEAENQQETLSENCLLYIHKHKTACLIESGFQIGAILAGAAEEEVRILGEIAEKVGIAFQIRDDILDVTGNSEELGKMTGQDEKDGKVTYVTMHGLDQAIQDVERMTKEALEAFDQLSCSNDFLRELMLTLMTRTK